MVQDEGEGGVLEGAEGGGVPSEEDHLRLEEEQDAPGLGATQAVEG